MNKGLPYDQYMSDNTEDVVLRVSSSRKPGYSKKVAGAMSWQLRDKGFCRARAIQLDAVNTAMKAVAIVNQKVSRAGLALATDLCLGRAEDGTNPASTAVEITVYDPECPRPEDFLEYKVSGRKEGNKELVQRLAGAIASPARDGKGVVMRCAGPSAVYRAVMASCLAKGHIYTNGMEAIIVPTWGTIPAKEEGDRPASIIEIRFWGRKP